MPTDPIPGAEQTPLEIAKVFVEDLDADWWWDGSTSNLDGDNVQQNAIAALAAIIQSERSLADQRVAEARREALEQAAVFAETFPPEVLALWDRPGGPPGNGFRIATFKDVADAIRRLIPEQPA